MTLRQGQRRYEGDNSGLGRNRWSWQESAALPRPVRDTLNYALRDLGSRRARMNLMAGKSVAEVCAIERAVAAGITRREILETWGAAHPFVSAGALSE